MKRTYNIKNSTLTIIFGDITTSEKEVIVSSDDGFLSMGGGVSGAIRKCCGESIGDEVKKHIPAALGDVIVTSAGLLPQKYIFHAVTISCEKRPSRTFGKADEDYDMQKYIIRHSVNKCFGLLHTMGLSSIAFPAIGAGSAGIPYALVAAEMSAIISENLFKTNRKLDVELYLFDRYGKMTDMDFVVFFEQIAISIHDVEMYSKEKERNNELCEEEMKVAETDIVDEPDNTQPHQVFISYSRQDKEVVLPICQILQAKGITIWIDLNGKYHGKNFKEVIVDAIEKSSVVLFVSSEKSNVSHYVQQEVAIAVECGKNIIPIILDDTKFAKNIYFDLCNIDWFDYRQRNTEVLNSLAEYIVNSMRMV